MYQPVEIKRGSDRWAVCLFGVLGNKVIDQDFDFNTAERISVALNQVKNSAYRDGRDSVFSKFRELLDSE